MIRFGQCTVHGCPHNRDSTCARFYKGKRYGRSSARGSRSSKGSKSRCTKDYKGTENLKAKTERKKKQMWKDPSRCYSRAAGFLRAETAVNLKVKETDLKGEDDLVHRLLACRAWELERRGFAYFTIIVSAKGNQRLLRST